MNLDEKLDEIYQNVLDYQASDLYHLNLVMAALQKCREQRNSYLIDACINDGISCEFHNPIDDDTELLNILEGANETKS